MKPDYFAEIIRSYLPEPHASLMNGILLGISVKKQWFFYQKLIDVGLVHLVVLSGMNITLLIQLVTSVISALPKTLRIWTSIITVVLFIAFVGIQPPIIRAAIMGILSLLGLLIGRKVQAWYSLILSAVISLILWPEWVSSLSFYLSYASTSGLILFTKPFFNIENPRKPLLKLCNYCISELQTSVAAQIFTIPLIWYYFGRISLISPVTNLLVGWTIAPLMVLGFITSVLGAISPDLGKLTAFFSYVLLSYIVAVVELFSKVLI